MLKARNVRALRVFRNELCEQVHYLNAAEVQVSIAKIQTTPQHTWRNLPRKRLLVVMTELLWEESLRSIGRQATHGGRMHRDALEAQLECSQLILLK